MALHDGSAALDLDVTFLDDDDVIEAPPSTKRLDRREILANVAAAEHVDDKCSTLNISPEEHRRLLANAFAATDDDPPCSEDITLEMPAPVVPLPDWVIDEQLRVVEEVLSEPPPAGRPWLGEARTARAIAAAWTVAAATTAATTYILGR